MFGLKMPSRAWYVSRPSWTIAHSGKGPGYAVIASVAVGAFGSKWRSRSTRTWLRPALPPAVCDVVRALLATDRDARLEVPRRSAGSMVPEGSRRPIDQPAET